MMLYHKSLGVEKEFVGRNHLEKGLKLVLGQENFAEAFRESQRCRTPVSITRTYLYCF